MNKKTGIIFVALGVIFLSVAIFLGGRVAWNTMEANKLIDRKVEPSSPVVVENLAVDTGEYLQVGYTLEVESKSTRENEGEIPSSEWIAQFKYPYEFQILDESGRKLYSESGYLNLDGDYTSWHDNRADSAAGYAHMTIYSDKFSVDSRDNLRFEAAIDFEDPRYDSKLKSARVYLYDNVTGTFEHLISIIIALVAFSGAVILVVAGVLIITSKTGGEAEKSEEKEAGSPDIFEKGIANFLIKYPFAAGISQFFITVGLLFISFLIFPAVIVLGYLYRLARFAALGKSCPPDYEDWGKLFREGILVVVALLPVIIPFILLGIFPHYFSARLNNFGVFVKYMLTLNIVGLLFSYLGVALLLTLISTGSVRATYAGGRFLRTAFTGSCLKIFLSFLLTAIMLNFSWIIIIFFALATVAGIFFFPLVIIAFQTYQFSAYFALLGYLFRKERQNGRLSKIINPARAGITW